MMNTNMEAIVWAMNARGLDPTAWKILMKLAARVNSERRDFDVWPSHKQLAEDCEISVATVKRHLAVLADKEVGFIKILPQTRANGATSSHRYRLMVKTKHTMPKGVEVSIDADAMDHEMSWGVAQSELGGSSLVNHADEPLKEEPTQLENPPSPDGEGTPVERDLLGDPIVSAEQRKAEEERELIEFIETEWHKLAADNPMTTDIEEITPRRRASVLARTAEKVKPDRTARQVWEQIFDQIRNSLHLRGLGKPGKDRTDPWAADFDWLIGPENFGKAFEGKYRDRRNQHPSYGADGRPITAVDAAARNVAESIRKGRARAADRGDSGGARPGGRAALPGR